MNAGSFSRTAAGNRALAGYRLDKMADRRKGSAINIVCLLSSLTAVLSMAVDHIFMALLLQLKTQQEMLIAQTTRQNKFVCRANENALRQERLGCTGRNQVGQIISLWTPLFLARLVSADLKHMGSGNNLSRLVAGRRAEVFI